MTPDQLNSLTFFRVGERQLDGTEVEWATYDYETMRKVEELRRFVDAPIRLIRGAHPGKPTAVDGVCLSVPLTRVVMELTRIPGISFGVYSGNSWHIDRREGPPARWLAIRPAERRYLTDYDVAHLVTVEPKDGWIYLPWSGPDGWPCLQLVCTLAQRARS